MLLAVAMEGSFPLTGDAATSETVVVLAVETTVLLEVTVGTDGKEGPSGTEGPNGMLGPSGTGLLTAVLVKVEVPEMLVRVGVARLSILDVNGS